MRRPLAVVFVALVLAVALAGCGSSSKKTRPAQRPQDMQGRATVEVVAQDNLFTPPDIVVSPNTKVTWVNRDAVVHNVQKSTDLVDFGGPFGADTAAFGPNATYSFTFTKPGIYNYTCTIHSFMTGVVRVQAGAATTTTTTTNGDPYAR